MTNLINPFEISEQVEFSADLCVKCNICTAACPVAPVTELFPGPKVVGPQWQRFRMNEERGDESPDKSVDYCSGCGMCKRLSDQHFCSFIIEHITIRIDQPILSMTGVRI